MVRTILKIISHGSFEKTKTEVKIMFHDISTFLGEKGCFDCKVEGIIGTKTKAVTIPDLLKTLNFSQLSF